MVRLGGEPVTPKDVELFHRHFGLGCVLVNGYGSTETGTSIYGRLDKLADTIGRLPIGQPLPGFDVGILDEQGAEVAPGEVGEITIRSRYLAAGYWNQPELTSSVFRESVEGDGQRAYRTGDLGRRLPDGSIVCLGRQDSQVKVRGQRVELGEVEHQLLQLPGIKEAAVLARADEGRELYLAAYLVWQAGVAPRRAAELRRELRQHLPDCAVPSAFVDLEALPMNGNGKVDVRALAAPAPTARTAPATVDAAPRNECERLLAQLWCEVLEIPHVGLQEDFFDLGGDSLAAAHLFVSIEKALGMRLPLEWLLESGSVEQLARRIVDQTARVDSLLVPLQSGSDRPPFYCVSALGGEVYSYRALAAHLGPDQPFYAIKARVTAPGEATVRSLEETATIYVEELLSFQPAGPYLLGGYSFGGAVAYEMAQQLRSRGHEVALLAIIDQRRPNLVPVHSWSARRIGLCLRNLPRWIRDELFTAGAPARVRRKLMKLFRHALASLLPGQPALIPSDTPGWLDESRVPADYLRLFRDNLRMLRSYIPQSYAGTVTLFRSRCQPLAPAAWHERDMGWGRLPRGGVEVIDIPGNHSSLLEEPNVCTLARRLREALDAAVAASRSPGSAGSLAAAKRRREDAPLVR
jgi:thioesterase domain-containing protein/acyl carrier protein